MIGTKISNSFSKVIFVQLSLCYQVGSIASYANDDFEIKNFTMIIRKRKHVPSCKAEVALTLKCASQQFVLSQQHLLKAM